MSAIAPAINPKSTHATFVSYPIDFDLYDENDNYILYIADDTAQNTHLTLELKNYSGRDIQFVPLNGAPAADNCHFELQFRKGVLSKKTVDLFKGVNGAAKSSVLKQSDSWDFSLDDTGNRAVSLYFLCKNPAAFFAATKKLFQTDQLFTLTLKQLAADAGGGARGTRVLFIPHQIQFSDNNTRVTGNREQNLFITNQAGQKQIPLHVGFAGPNRILNDGNPHDDLKLTLQIQNVAKPGVEHLETPRIMLRAKNDLKGISESLLIISFDVQADGEDRPWALCRDTELHLISTVQVIRQLQQNNLWIEQADPDATFTVSDWAAGQGQSRQITLRPTADLALNAGDYIRIDLSGFQSSLPSGFAKMYVNYANIPGYWDGHYVCTVEKAPLLFSQSNVGIGTVSPGAKLDVKADAAPAGGWYEAIRFSRTENSAITHPEGGLLFGMHRDRSFNFVDVKAGTQPKTLMQIEADTGNVGIGTINPAAKLSFSNVKDSTAPDGITWNNLDPMGYGIHRTAGAWTDPDHQQLRLGWRTGIILDPGSESPRSYVDVKGILRVTTGDSSGGNQSELGPDEEGSLELGVNYETPGIGTPYIDFHYAGKQEDFNTRIINSGDGRLSVNASTLHVTGKLGIGTESPGAAIDVNAQTLAPGGWWEAIRFSNPQHSAITHPGGGLLFGMHSDRNFYFADTGEGNFKYVMQINASTGNVGIGTTNPQGKLHVAGTVYTDGKIYAAGGLAYYWGPDGVWKRIENRASDWAGSYTDPGPSDIRLKTELKPVTGALEKVLQIRGVYYRWAQAGLDYLTRDVEKTISAGPDATEEEHRLVQKVEKEKLVAKLQGNQIGLIAQEVESVVPELVHTDEEGIKSIDYAHLAALLVEAIKEQSALINDLKSRLSALEKVAA